jgi:hypothetical protein
VYVVSLVFDTYYLAGLFFKQDCCNALCLSYPLSDIYVVAISAYKAISIVSIFLTADGHILSMLTSISYIMSWLLKRLDQNVISLSKDRTIAVVHSMTSQH